MRRSTSSGILALLGIGVYVAIRNRQMIVDFLNRQGVKLPDAERLVNRVRQGASDIVSQVSNASDQVEDETLKRAS